MNLKPNHETGKRAKRIIFPILVRRASLPRRPPRSSRAPAHYKRPPIPPGRKPRQPGDERSAPTAVHASRNRRARMWGGGEARRAEPVGAATDRKIRCRRGSCSNEARTSRSSASPLRRPRHLRTMVEAQRPAREDRRHKAVSACRSPGPRRAGAPGGCGGEAREGRRSEAQQTANREGDSKSRQRPRPTGGVRLRCRPKELVKTRASRRSARGGRPTSR